MHALRSMFLLLQLLLCHHAEKATSLFFTHPLEQTPTKKGEGLIQVRKRRIGFPIGSKKCTILKTKSSYALLYPEIRPEAFFQPISFPAIEQQIHVQTLSSNLVLHMLASSQASLLAEIVAKNRIFSPSQTHTVIDGKM